MIKRTAPEHIYAIGDIHGQFDKLQSLLKRIGKDAHAVFVFLGDYIDRGPKSKEVVDLLIQFSKTHKCIFLKGNHEDLFDKARDYIDKKTEKTDHFVLWIMNGGDATCKSYGGCGDIYSTHKEFFNSLKIIYETEHYIFVHAGLKPGIPISKQKKMDMLWIRDEFILNSTGFFPEKTIIYGHTCVDMCTSPFPDKIGLDTGAAWGGPLSAVKLPENEIIRSN